MLCRRCDSQLSLHGNPHKSFEDLEPGVKLYTESKNAQVFCSGCIRNMFSGGVYSVCPRLYSAAQSEWLYLELQHSTVHDIVVASCTYRRYLYYES